MAYVVYNKETTRTLYVKGKEYYATEAAAKAALTRAWKKGKIEHRYNWDVAEVGYFRANIEKIKVVKNLMSGKDVRISVNTPRCCDPSSETYWSM
jgi:hypothetical protein